MLLNLTVLISVNTKKLEQSHTNRLLRLPCCLPKFSLTQYKQRQVHRGTVPQPPMFTSWPRPHLATPVWAGGPGSQRAQPTGYLNLDSLSSNLPHPVHLAMNPTQLSGLYLSCVSQNCPLLGEEATGDCFYCSLLEE